MTNFRHEWKHEINPADCMLLKSRLQAVMTPDVHGENGYYEIRSLYFDDASDSALRDKMDGINIREKFRIRCYDRNLTMIRLEKKSKINGLCAKESAILTMYDVMRILDGDIEWMKDSNRWLVRQLYERMLYQGLKPKTLVDYRREAYTFDAGNVRVTLDDEIHTGLLATSFVDFMTPVVPAEPGAIILEVKWDAFLPEVIRDAVQLTGRHTSSFSKYEACRYYG